MKCSICGSHFNGIGNNPEPLCEIDDAESRCCDVCNTYVINARLAQLKRDTNVDIGDTIVIFFAKNSTKPIEMLVETGKFLAGIVDYIDEKDDRIIYEGTWGSFIVDSKTDQYVKV